MSRKISLLLGIFLVAAACGGTEPFAPPPADDTGILLLRNGQVIEGHVEHNADYYTVTSPDQVTQVRAADVEFFCHDLRAGYQQKKAAMQPNEIEQHIQLFLWCERHGLLDCAGDELKAAEALDRQHPMISVLQRRLKVEMQAKKEPVHPADSGPLPPSDEQLERMIRDMPPGTVESFVQVVQPILLNHCPGAIGYVLPGQRRLQLMRPPLGESPSRRITERNLYAVLQCIDCDKPGESLLLKASVGSGTAESVGAFPRKHSMQYDKLVQWVYLVAQKPLPAEEMENASADNASFADLAAGGAAPSLPVVNRVAPRLPSAPSSNAGPAKPAVESAAERTGERATPAKPSAVATIRPATPRAT